MNKADFEYFQIYQMPNEIRRRPLLHRPVIAILGEIERWAEGFADRREAAMAAIHCRRLRSIARLSRRSSTRAR